MISLYEGKTCPAALGAGAFRIEYARAAWADTAVYKSGEGGLVSVTPGGACTVTGDFEKEELISFLSFIKPESVFCVDTGAPVTLPGYKPDAVTLLEYGGAPARREEGFCFDLSSDKVYSVLAAVNAFSLPPFEDFAVDYCRRKNHGFLICAAKENAAAAIAFTLKDAALVNGVASIEKGMGSRALGSLLSRLGGKRVFAAAANAAVPFYLKNGFSPAGRAVCLEKTAV